MCTPYGRRQRRCRVGPCSELSPQGKASNLNGYPTVQRGEFEFGKKRHEGNRNVERFLFVLPLSCSSRRSPSMMLAKASINEAGGGREAAAGLYCVNRRSPMSMSGGEAPSSEDLGKKTRKPYTITKSRESWTEQDHDKFLEALQLFDRDWKKIEAFVGSKTVIQIRSHAQKYFLKVQKNGTNEHVPPPRPKRKATHPYPQKSAKNGPQIPEAKILFCESCLLESDHSSTRESSSIQRNHTDMTITSLPQNTMQPSNTCHLTKDGIVNAGVLVESNSDSSVECSRAWSACDITDEENLVTSLHVLPDFAQVYSFLGSVFDPNTSGHLQRLKMMDPIDVETVLILMGNLAFNLTSPEFEDHDLEHMLRLNGC